MNQNSVFFYENLNFLSSKKFLSFKNYNNYYYDNYFIEYLKLYRFVNRYKNISFEINDIKNFLICPITIENKDSETNLNYFGEPFLIYGAPKSNDFFQQKLKEVFIDIIEKNNIKNFQYKKYIEQDNINRYLESETKKIQTIGTESVISLSPETEKIFGNFSKGHKSSIKIEYTDLSYHLYDYKNYKDKQIFEMMKLHEIVSNKKTRSEDSWKINEKMIINKKGFLIKVMNKDKLISYSLFFHDELNAIYFSSCTLRDNFKSYKNIIHKSIWMAIKYLKKIKCINFILGNTKTLFNQKELSSKEKNVEKFKSSFGGDKFNYIIYKNIPNQI